SARQIVDHLDQIFRGSWLQKHGDLERAQVARIKTRRIEHELGYELGMRLTDLPEEVGARHAPDDVHVAHDAIEGMLQQSVESELDVGVAFHVKLPTDHGITFSARDIVFPKN